MKATNLNTQEFVKTLENKLVFSVKREEYAEKQTASKNEIVSFDDFLFNIWQQCEANAGDIEDAIFIAEDAYLKI